MTRHGPEQHRAGRAGWLRAAVLGANDGLISTASLMVGVAAANGNRSAIMIAGVAGLTAGALSMAAGEYVSVSSQLDTERADLAREQTELDRFPDFEIDELTAIYQRRGLTAELARQVAEQLSAGDPIGAHARDELGLDPEALANPAQASIISAASFAAGAAVPVIVMALTSSAVRVMVTMIVTLVGLVALGALGARIGGAPPRRAALRVAIGGVLALTISLAIGRVTGTAL